SKLKISVHRLLRGARQIDSDAIRLGWRKIQSAGAWTRRSLDHHASQSAVGVENEHIVPRAGRHGVVALAQCDGVAQGVVGYGTVPGSGNQMSNEITLSQR